MTEPLERIMAYLDGELDAAQRQAFEAEIAADPALDAEVQAHHALAARLSAAYGSVLDEPVPPGLALSAVAANDAAPRRPWALAWGGMAAALVVGVVAGRLVLTPQALTPGHAVPARTKLAQALEHGLAASPGVVRIGLSFRDATGRYCRTFQSAPDRLAGLACRDDGGWRMETATAWKPAPGPEYRTAASDTPPAVLAAVDEALAGEVFDAAQERAARDRGWR